MNSFKKFLPELAKYSREQICGYSDPSKRIPVVVIPIDNPFLKTPEFKTKDINVFVNKVQEKLTTSTVAQNIRDQKQNIINEDVRKSKSFDFLISFNLGVEQKEKIKALNPIKRNKQILDYISSAKLIIYEKGDFFSPHYDSSIEMLTYLIFPPHQQYEGGLLQLYDSSILSLSNTPDKSSPIFKFDGSNLKEWTLVVFPYNIRHECTLITEGRRICIKLNPYDCGDQRHVINDAILEWLKSKSGEEKETDNLSHTDVEKKEKDNFNVTINMPHNCDCMCIYELCDNLVSGKISLDNFKTAYEHHVSCMDKDFFIDYYREYTSPFSAQVNMCCIKREEQTRIKDRLNINTYIDVNKVDRIVKENGECIIILDRPYPEDVCPEILIGSDRNIYDQLCTKYNVIVKSSLIGLKESEELFENVACYNTSHTIEIENKGFIKEISVEYNDNTYDLFTQRVVVYFIVIPK